MAAVTAAHEKCYFRSTIGIAFSVPVTNHKVVLHLIWVGYGEWETIFKVMVIAVDFPTSGDIPCTHVKVYIGHLLNHHIEEST
ncbi:hypothetical protein C5167_047299 [Papaver somniferum]|uniref:Uncharacterized protein n=1 Tax=Papaver somniferum TaxID=3469 RepID=A0A4Y7LG86_PAPSO|nr:hypothetical protein C5167_047299 [Papaver somniferum]